MRESGAMARMKAEYSSIQGRTSVGSPVDSQVRASLRRVIGGHLPADRDASILDAGCGEGHCLIWLQSLGFTNLDGFDLSTGCVAACHSAGLDFVRHGSLFSLDEIVGDRRYELILLIDVIEHMSVSEGIDVLSGLKSRLEPGGRLLIQTPNMGSLFAPLLLHDDLTHKVGYTERSIVNLFVAAGYSRSRVFVKPAWAATTALGRVREIALMILHIATTSTLGSLRPRIASNNILVEAFSS